MWVRPDRETFEALASRWALVPVWAELLADVSTPVGMFPVLAGDGPGVLLESVERSERWGRYSFVAGDPAAVVTVDQEGHIEVAPTAGRPVPGAPAGGGALEGLKRLAASLAAPRLPDLPPLTGGLVGFVAYEAASLLQGHPAVPGDPGCPPMRFLLVDRAVVFDHWRQRLLLVAHVPAATGYEAAIAAMEELAERVRTPTSIRPEAPAVPGPANGFASNLTDDDFRKGVVRAKEHILAGDIFQVVLSRRLRCEAPGGAVPIYRRLRVTNPAPYMFLFRAQGLELAGSSPEPLVRVEGRRVLSRPIAGTRRRGADREEDARLERELLADAKERAEHAMLVDLARNDLGIVCTPGTVRPTELMAVERFSRVMHIVSTVEGELRAGLTPLDALAATFPAGTVTGAPKRRAMEIIAEAEPTPRGPYAGAVGYLTFAGDMDFCITIRTAVVAHGHADVQAGAGVVADSDPDRELRETEEKASALLAAVTGVAPESDSGPETGAGLGGQR
jgi:anthranilate synthase component 1